MRDQPTEIDAAFNEAFAALADHSRTTGTRFTGMDLARSMLLELRSRGVRIEQVTVSRLLGQIVADGFLMTAETQDLFWRYGDVVPAMQEALWLAFDEVEVGKVIERAFSESDDPGDGRNDRG